MIFFIAHDWPTRSMAAQFLHLRSTLQSLQNRVLSSILEAVHYRAIETLLMMIDDFYELRASWYTDNG